jgi:hypothetical protein
MHGFKNQTGEKTEKREWLPVIWFDHSRIGDVINNLLIFLILIFNYIYIYIYIYITNFKIFYVSFHILYLEN